MLAEYIWLILLVVFFLLCSITLVSVYLVFSLKKLSQQKDSYAQTIDSLNEETHALSHQLDQATFINAHIASLGLDLFKYDLSAMNVGSPQNRLRTLLEHVRSNSLESTNFTNNYPLVLRQWIYTYCGGTTGRTTDTQLKVLSCPDLLLFIDSTWLTFLVDTIWQYHLSNQDSPLYLTIEQCYNNSQNLRLHFSNSSTSISTQQTLPFSHSDQVELMLLQQQLEKMKGSLGYFPEKNNRWSMTISFPCSFNVLPPLGEAISMTNLPVAPDNAPLLLIVSCDSELSNWLIEQLSDIYRIVTCSSIKGLDHQLKESQPDLIVSSMKFPDGKIVDWMNQSLESDNQQLIPFVVLCDENDVSTEHEAWKNLANDVITHPINISILKVRLEASITNRIRLQKHLLSLALPAPHLQVLPISPNNKQKDVMYLGEYDKGKIFARDLQTAAVKLINNGKISAELLAENMHISSRTLQRKVKDLFGITCSQFIRSAQLELAKEKLEQGLSIKEAALSSAFTDQAHFSNAFKASYKMTPTDYKKSLTIAQTDTEFLTETY